MVSAVSIDSQGSSKAPGCALGDEARLRRLRWRARRGLLENDLIMTRFFDTHGAHLDEATVQGLDQLLDLPDNELLDLLLGRTHLSPELAATAAGRALALLRDV